MKLLPHPAGALCAGFFGLFLLAGSGQAQDRAWTSADGRKIQGSFISQDSSSVKLRLAGGKEVAVAKALLSGEDLKHLATLPGGSPAGAGGTAPSPQQLFLSAKVDPKSWKIVLSPHAAGPPICDKSLTSPRCLVMAPKGVKDEALINFAETAERLSAALDGLFPVYAATMGQKRIALYLSDTKTTQEAIGQWLLDKKSLSPSQSYSFAQFNITGGDLSEELQSQHGLMPSYRVFSMLDPDAKSRNLKWPERIHFMASTMLRGLMLPVKSKQYEPDFAMINFGFAYQMELEITGKITTSVSFGGNSEGLDIFKKSRGWGAPTRKLLQESALRPSIADLLKLDAEKATPRDLAFAVGLMDYIQHDATRLKLFSAAMEQILKDEAYMAADDFAKALGFASAEALNKGWVDHLLSSAFK